MLDGGAAIRTLAVAMLLAACWSVGAAFAQRSAAAPTAGGERGWIGVFLGDAVDGGVELIAIVPEGPAARAGLRVGDVVVGVEQTRLIDVAALSRILDEARPGRPLQLQVLRSGEMLQRLVDPARRPPSPALVSSVVPAPVRPPGPPPAPGAPRHLGAAAYGLAVAEVSADLRRHLGAPAGAGVLVTRIDAGRPAALDGLRVGDVLVRLGGAPVLAAEDLERLLRETSGRGILATLVREGRPTTLTVRSTTREAAPDADNAARGMLLEQGVRLEIEKLERRIERLKRELERLEEGEEERRR